MKILVMPYGHPDLDGFACAVAYAEFLNKTGQAAVPTITGEPSAEAVFIMREFDLVYPEKVAKIEPGQEIILVDCSDLFWFSSGINTDQVIEVIDHRQVHNARIFTKAKVQIELVGAAATLIAEKFKEQDVQLSSMSAVLLYSAIISNTLNFQSGTTTSRDQAAASWLKNQTKIPDDLPQKMFLAKSDLSGGKLSQALNDCAIFNAGKFKFGICQIEMIGAAELVKNHKAGILRELAARKQKNNLDLILLTIIELAGGFNIFVSADQLAQKILATALGVEFSDDIATRAGLIMRKEIAPKIKEVLEKQYAI